MIKIAARPMRQSDTSFVFQSWLNNFKDSPSSRRITHDIYFDNHHRVIENILERSTTTALVACDPDDEDTICGYLVFERVADETVIHYAFVKAIYQRKGVFKSLLEAANIEPNRFTFTHWTYAAGAILDRRQFLGKTVFYDPYRL